MAFNQLKERMREHQAEMKRRSEQRKDAQELRRNRRIQVDLEPVLGESAGADGKGKIGSNASPSSGGPAAVKWEDYKDQLQRFYDDRGMDLGGFGDGDSEDEDEDDADADADYSGGEGDLKTKKKKKKTKKKRGKTGATAVSEVPEEFRKHRTEGTDVSQLPEEFFQTASAKFDVVDYVLEALPEHLDNLALIPFIQSEIERNDVFRDRVRQDLTAVVMEKYVHLIVEISSLAFATSLSLLCCPNRGMAFGDLHAPVLSFQVRYICCWDANCSRHRHGLEHCGCVCHQFTAPTRRI